MAELTVLYFGVYHPSYARNWVLINSLKKNGVEVIECRTKPGRLSFLKLLYNFFRINKRWDVMIVGFPGQEVMFLARFLTLLSFSGQARRPIIFDAFTSHYGGYILDRKKWPSNSFRAKYFKFLDRWSCKLADLVLLDTQAHINFFVEQFWLPGGKFRRIWIGANDENFKPISNIDRDDKFRIIFFGTYVPLQGAEYIVQAAKLLENEKDIFFYFIGKGQDKSKCLKLAQDMELKNIMFIDMMKSEDLKMEIAKSDIVLGLFGNTPKTPLVIPNKVFEALAMKKPVITADTPAIRELLSEDEIFLVAPANPKEIASAVIKLKNDPELRSKLAEKGYGKFISSASTAILGQELKKIIKEVLNA